MEITVPICGNNGKSHFPLLPQIGKVTPAILEIYEPFQIPIVENRCKTNMATYVNSAGIRPPPFRRLKKQPERFQESTEKFDIILTVEEKVYDQVLTSFEKRESGVRLLGG